MIRAFLLVFVMMTLLYTVVATIALPVLLVLALVAQQRGSDLARWRWAVGWMVALAVVMAVVALVMGGLLVAAAGDARDPAFLGGVIYLVVPLWDAAFAAAIAVLLVLSGQRVRGSMR